MARYQVILAYDGTQYHGFQRQVNACTVQAEVEKALQALNWRGTSILAAGRTDVGVHASGQVISFDLAWKHPTDALGRAINANLPPDIAVKAIKVVRDDFHPRFDALWRSYRYSLYYELERNPLRDRYAWRIDEIADIDLLKESARVLLGTHDFAVLGKAPVAGGSTVRTISEADWFEHQDGIIQFHVTANAFLYHMVRRMVFLSVLVGQKKLALEEFSKGVQEKKPQTPGLAPPNGLFLSNVIYDL